MPDQPPPYQPGPPPYQPPGGQGGPGNQNGPFPGGPSGPYSGAPGPGGPYAGGPYAGGPFQQAPFPGGLPQPPKSHTTRNVLLTLLVVVLVVCGGGGVTGFVLIKHAVDRENAKRHYAGNPDDPITVKPGQAFSIRGDDFAKGWRLNLAAAASSAGEDAIAGLRVTNDGSSSESVSVTFSFLKGSTVDGQVDCYTTGSIDDGQTASLTCFVEDDQERVDAYDSITVADSYQHY